MFKISITNLLTNKKYTGRFETKKLCLEWHTKKIDIHGNENATPPTAKVTIENITSDIIANNKAILLENYSKVELLNLAPVAAVQMLKWANSGNAKAIENIAWVEHHWNEYDKKKRLLENNIVIDLNPSSVKKPHKYTTIKNEIN